MKKILSRICALLLCLAVSFALASCSGTPADAPQSDSSLPAGSEESSTSAEPQQPLPTPTETETEPEPFTMADALFIGDSRTEDLGEYTDLEGDFFASVGMSVYNIHKKPIPVTGVGKTSLNDLLANRKYGKIYLMLGLNELGYNMDQTVNRYTALVTEIRSAQPDAKIFLMANLHVTQTSDGEDGYTYNSSIDTFNEKISKFADGSSIFYLDVNPVFDDDTGALDPSLTSDGVHLYAKHDPIWAKWITEQTASLLADNTL